MTTSTAPAKLISRDALGIVYMLLSGTGVVFLPTTAKLAYESGSDVLTVAFSRGIIAVVILFSAAIIVKQSLRLPRDLLVHSIVVGIAGALFVYGIFGAIVSINISLAILILYLYPMALAVYEHLAGSTLLRAGQWFWGSIAFAGLALILGVNLEQVSFVGVALAILSLIHI